MNAVLYEIECNGKTTVARSRKDAIRYAKTLSEMQHCKVTIISTVLRTGKEIKTVFDGREKINYVSDNT